MLHEAAPCTCGLLYGSCGGGCSLLFAAAAGDHHHHHYYRHCGGDGEAFSGGPYGGSVDCTLSLGTPSTRRRGQRCGRSPVRQLRHHLHAALEERPARTQVAVQRVRDPVQEGGAARGGRGGAAGVGQWGGVRVHVRVRAAAAAVGLLRPGGRGEGGVFRHVRRRGRRGGRAVPAVGARRDAGVVAGVRGRPGDAQPVPVLLGTS